ncbi:uncharacterized protein LOC123262616 isoform X1 [Cotesia glomerata]|uniref:uncharacterized protein LOC123262616 isoform X1 n=1 Tax=Cotesia glomerata TaxID=32391 RepID=UPI001D026799|nr:uncharacterized protein LOC123262616 isoform X1 [Cotesia glomerata]
MDIRWCLQIVWCLLLIGVVKANSISTTPQTTSSTDSSVKPKPKVRRSNFYLSSNGATIPSYKLFDTNMNIHALRTTPTINSFSHSFPKSEFTKSPLINSFTPYEVNSLKLIPENSKITAKAYYKSPSFYTSSSFPKFSQRPSASSAGQYGKNYPEIKSISISPSFSASEVTSGGFKPISPPQYQSNPQSELSKALRGYEDSYQSYGNPTTSSLASSLENFPTYSVKPIHPTIRTNLPFAPTTAVSKIKSSDNYQLLSAQPQLHFTAAIPLPQQPIYHSQPFGRIKTDVEVITKRPQILFPEDSSEEVDFKSTGIPVSEESYEPLQTVKNVKNDNRYQLPDSSIFKSYDEAFGKLYHTTKVPVVHGTPRPHTPKLIEKPPQYGVSSSAEAEKQVYEHSDEYSSGSNENYHPGGNSNQGSHQKYSQEGSDFEMPHFENFGRDFKQDFEESYHSELPREEYKQVREVSKVDETNSRPKISSSGRETIRSRRPNKPRKSYAVDESAGVETTYERIVAKNPQESSERQVPVENFGYKIPKSSRTTGFNNEQTTEPSKPTYSAKKSKNQSSRNSELRKQTSHQFNSPYSSSQPKSLDQSPTVENVLVLPFIYKDNLNSNYHLLNDPVG